MKARTWMKPANVAGRVAQSPKLMAAAVFALVLLYLAFSSGSSGSALPDGCPKSGRRYAVIMDGGSTGSRVHIYPFDDHNGRVTLAEETFVQLKPGLSSFADEPEKAAASLLPLLAEAIKTVPRELHKCTPIQLKATAGLRLIGAAKSTAILAAVERLFRKHDFIVSTGAVALMDGRDEGAFAWATVNFLLGAITPRPDRASTAAVFDMGGASTQVVFKPTTVKALAAAPKLNKYSLQLFGKSTELYTHSHLGYGLKEAGKKMVVAAGDVTNFACFPADHSVTVKLDGGAVVTASNVDNSAQSFDKCLIFAKTILKKGAPCSAEACSFNGIYQPPLQANFKGDIYVFSYFFDRMEPFMNAPDGQEVSITEFRETGEKICGGVGKYGEHNKGSMCMDFAYLYALLTTGYGMPDTTPLQIMKKIKGLETAWCLGAALNIMEFSTA